MTETVEKAKPGPKPKATRSSKIAVAVFRINGEIEPGTALSLGGKDYEELVTLGAVRDATDAEVALFEKNPGSLVNLGGPATDPIDAVLD